MTSRLKLWRIAAGATDETSSTRARGNAMLRRTTAFALFRLITPIVTLPITHASARECTKAFFQIDELLIPIQERPIDRSESSAPCVHFTNVYMRLLKDSCQAAELRVGIV